MERVRANGVEIAVGSRGEGEAVLLVMGIGASSALWPPSLIDAIAAAGFRVLWFDNRETGRSARLDDLGHPSIPRAAARRALGLAVRAPYTLSAMAADAVGVLDALGVDRAHVLGTSLGGMIAQHVGIEHPSRVRSLVLAMTSTGRLRDAVPGPRALKKLLERYPAEDEAAFVEGVVAFFAAVRGPEDPPDRALIEAYARETWRIGPTTDAGFARQAVAMLASGDRSPALAHLGLPVHVIHGAADPLVPPAAGKALAAAIPCATLEIVPGMGHVLPPRVWPRLVAALTRLRDAAVRESGDASRAAPG